MMRTGFLRWASMLGAVSALLVACDKLPHLKDGYGGYQYDNQNLPSDLNARYCEELGTTPLKIVNGDITNEFSAVIRITNGKGACTATVVSDTTILTAKHCLNGTEAWGGGVVHDGAYANSARSSSVVDLAVVVFNAGTFRVRGAPLMDRLPVKNDVITLVGYGQTDLINNNRADGLKRVGCNRLREFADRSGTIITFHPSNGDYLHYRSPISTAGLRPGDNSMTGRGDSGGPIFINGKLAGVVSFGNTRASLMNNGKGYTFMGETEPDANALYDFDVNVYGYAARNLFRDAVLYNNAKIPGY